MATLTPNGRQYYTDNAGNPLAGGKLYTYASGTNVPLATFANESGTIPNTNPVILDGRGEATVFWLGMYKATLKDALDNTIWTVDGINAVNLLSLLAAATGSSQIGYIEGDANSKLWTVGGKLRETVTVTDFMTDAQRAAVLAGASTDDTAAFTAALASYAKEIIVPAGTYRVGGVLIPSGKSLRGAGKGKTIVRIVNGYTGSIISSSGTVSSGIRDMTIDGSGTDLDGNIGLYLVGTTNFHFSDLEFIATGGSAYWGVNAARTRGTGISITGITDPNSWAFHVQGLSSKDSIYDGIVIHDCFTRAVMVRDAAYVNVSNVSCTNNRGTAMWFQNCLWCIATNIVDNLDLFGDSFVIEGASLGCWIIGATAKNCGGHGASIAGNVLYGSPQDCHMANIYSEEPGECIACISGQTALAPVVNCTVRGVYGKLSGSGNTGPGGPELPTEGFAITSGTGCTIAGRISDARAAQPSAVAEQGGNAGSSNNRFEIEGWIAGSNNVYGTLVSSSSVIKHALLDERIERKGDVDFTWSGGTSGTTIIYDQAALTVDRTITLTQAWSNREILVTRQAGGAFNLLVKQGAATVVSLPALTWARLKYDGANWNVIARGSL